MLGKMDHSLKVGRYQLMALRDFHEGDLGLTNREHSILHLLLRGQSLKGMALKLDISTHTADTHVRRIYKKLGVNSKAGAAAIAIAFLSGATVERDETNTHYTFKCA